MACLYLIIDPYLDVRFYRLHSVGGVAVGGAAAGYYVCAGAGAGEHVIAQNRSDPEALAFFRENGLDGPCPARRHRPRR